LPRRLGEHGPKFHPEERLMKKMLLTGVALGLGLAFATAASAQIKIGVAGPITGPNAAFGAQLKNGAEQAVEDINAAGGINGQKLQLVVGDDVSDPKQGVSVANKFVSESVKLVVGHFNSGVSIPASEVYQESGILQITPASTNPRFTERNMWNTFRTCGRDDQQGEVAGTYLSKNFKGKKVAIVHDKTPYGKGLADETQKSMNKLGLKEVMYEGVNTGEKDYSALVSKLKQANVDVVYFGGLHTEAGLIIRQMRDQGLNAPMMSGDGIVSSEFVSIAGPGAEGTLMTFSPDPRKNPNAKDAVAKFKAKNFEPEAYTLYTYAAVQIMAEAAKQAGGIDGKKMAEAMKKGTPYKTVIGDISFDKKGDITRPDYVMYVWKKDASGKITYVELGDKGS
jgi:branched-chain amino acid transport system substrate-binding protein